MKDECFPEILQKACFRSLWENASENMFVLRKQEGTFFIQAINPAQEKVINFSNSEASGRDLASMFPPALFERFRSNYDRCLVSGTPLNYEESYINHEGVYSFWETFLVPVYPENGESEYLLGIARNITPLREAEKALDVLRQAVEQANQAKYSFLANMSHEMRTPLNGISGAVSLFIESPSPEERKELAEIILSSVESLSVITNDILDFAKLNAGILRLEMSTFSIRELFESVLNIVRPMTANRGLALEYHVADDVPPVLFGDTSRISQILLNLVGNAVKFTHSGAINVNAVIRGFSSGQVTVMISVRDTGIGIKESDLARIFNPFFQIDCSTTRKHSGAGLGLAISRNLAELMGGEIHASSSLGQGSTFSVILPLKTVAPCSSGYAEKEADALIPATEKIKFSENQGGAVLLAEDNQVNSMVASKILRKNGFEVVCAFNGEEAVRKFNERFFDVVLMDWNMPVMDGIEAARQIRLLPGGNEVLIIGLTANALEEHRQQCIEAGMNDVLTKPIDRERLVSKIEQWLTKRGNPEKS